MSTLRLTPVLAVFVACTMAAGCEGAGSAIGGQRETLPSGTVVVRHAALAGMTEDTLAADLRLGSIEGTAQAAFASVRGLEVGPDGRIYVLDQQAAELWSFAPDGSYLATLARRGEGPGELDRPNGLALGSDGTLWVHDAGHDAIIGLSLDDAREVARYPSFGSGSAIEPWNGALDAERRFWRPQSHTIRPFPDTDETGVYDGLSGTYLKSFDARTFTFDSVFLGTVATFRRVVAQPNGMIARGTVPNVGERLVVIGPEGEVWTALSDAYRLARIDAETGDTVLIIEVDQRGPSLAPEDREWLDAALKDNAPDAKPVLNQLVVDDESRLWVGRGVAEGEASRYDLFDTAGGYLGSVRIPGLVPSFHPPVIRRGRVYALTADTLGVQYVVRGPVPRFEASGGPD